MKKGTVRIVLFVTAVPAVIGIILFLPFKNFLVVNVLFIGIAVASTLEAGKLILKKSAPLIRYAAAVLSGLLCTWAFLDTARFFGDSFPGKNFESAFFISIAGLMLLFSVLVPKKTDMPKIIPRAGAGLFLIFYPGVFFVFCIKCTGLENPAFLLLFLILTIFISDSMAYVTGKLFGKRGTVITEVSPNKTIIGFLTEIFISCAAAAAAAVFFPLRFPLHPALAALLGIGLGLTAIGGDLFESALKRSAGVKDSGRVIPGRGGFLDSLDSLLFSAPLFYFVFAGL
jgi:phosphatidate cytidylyltransferase